MSYPTYGPPSSPPLGFTEALRLAWARKLEVSGRSRRSEYWWLRLGAFLVTLAVYLVVAILTVVGSAIGHGVEYVTDSIAGVALLALVVALVVIEFTALVRRLHDTDKSGWWMLIGLVPLVGGILLLVFTVTDGTPGPNRFGASLKDTITRAGGYPGGGYGDPGWPAQQPR